MPSAIKQPQLPSAPTGQEFNTWQTQQQLVDLLSAMQARKATESVKEISPNNNNWFAVPTPASTSPINVAVAKTRSDILAIPGAVYNDVIVSGTLILTNVRVTGTVSVAATGVIIATNCRFEQQVQLASGARGHFIGCFTKGISNAGGALNCFIIGCHRDGGVDAGGITIIAQTS